MGGLANAARDRCRACGSARAAARCVANTAAARGGGGGGFRGRGCGTVGWGAHTAPAAHECGSPFPICLRLRAVGACRAAAPGAHNCAASRACALCGTPSAGRGAPTFRCASHPAVRRATRAGRVCALAA